MIYQKSSKHSPQEVEQSLREAAQRHKFGVLHVLDLKKTLHDKGIDLANEVRIYDVCNPLAASQALHQDMATATVLPCRIAVYSNAGGSTIATVKPTDLFEMCIRDRLLVVPREKPLAKGARVFDRAEAFGELGTVLEGLEPVSYTHLSGSGLGWRATCQE